MKRVHKKLTTLCISLSLCAASLAGCGASTQLSSPETQASAQTEAVRETPEAAESAKEASEPAESAAEAAAQDGLYIEPVEGISDDFIRGMDASSVLVEENSGVKYYNFYGE